mmetsp:Transcript_23386/g.59040  ORF Transcript_23386/g.59040 Transcript_23386/m.59040 type:complete len:367 (+) Transcript_23386:169-1269(+)
MKRKCACYLFNRACQKSKPLRGFITGRGLKKVGDLQGPCAVGASPSTWRCRQARCIFWPVPLLQLQLLAPLPESSPIIHQELLPWPDVARSVEPDAPLAAVVPAHDIVSQPGVVDVASGEVIPLGGNGRVNDALGIQHHAVVRHAVRVPLEVLHVAQHVAFVLGQHRVLGDRRRGKGAAPSRIARLAHRHVSGPDGPSGGPDARLRIHAPADALKRCQPPNLHGTVAPELRQSDAAYHCCARRYEHWRQPRGKLPGGVTGVQRAQQRQARSHDADRERQTCLPHAPPPVQLFSQLQVQPVLRHVPICLPPGCLAASLALAVLALAAALCGLSRPPSLSLFLPLPNRAWPPGGPPAMLAALAETRAA